MLENLFNLLKVV